jgi:hypothetical protein
VTDHRAVRGSWRTRVALVLLVAGLALAAAQLVPLLMQQKQPLAFDWGNPSPPVTRLDFTWQPLGEESLLGGASVVVPRGHTGPWRHTLSVPEDTYLFTVSLHRTYPNGETVETTYQRHVTLDGRDTTILLHERP